jgi:hypothetical protein
MGIKPKLRKKLVWPSYTEVRAPEGFDLCGGGRWNKNLKQYFFKFIFDEKRSYDVFEIKIQLTLMHFNINIVRGAGVIKFLILLKGM